MVKRKQESTIQSTDSLKYKAAEEEFRKRNKAVNKRLELALKSLLTPGIVIEEKWGVPLFWVSKNEPDVFIRRLNGREQRGRMIDSEFQAIDGA